MQKVLDFYFCKPAFFSPVTRDVPSHVEQQLLGTVWTFMPFYSKWAIPEQCLGLSLWRDLRVWIFQPKEDIAPAVGLFSHRECHCHGLVWVCSCDTWSPTYHSGCKDGVSSLKRNTITCALQYSLGGFIHPECQVLTRGSPLESPPPPLLVLESSGLCLPLLTADASYLDLANRNMAVTETFCGNSPQHLCQFGYLLRVCLFVSFFF